eukprot:UN09858
MNSKKFCPTIVIHFSKLLLNSTHIPNPYRVAVGWRDGLHQNPEKSVLQRAHASNFKITV